MKKALSLVLALLMVLSMTACGSSGTETPSAAPAATNGENASSSTAKTRA